MGTQGLSTACILAILCLAARSLQAETPGSAASPGGVLRRVVLLKYKPEVTPEQVRAFDRSFRSLPSRISAAVELDAGTNIQSAASAGFTHCNVWTFADAAARMKFLADPAHLAIGVQVRPYLEKALVIEYSAEPGR